MGWALDGLIGGVGAALSSDADMRGDRIKAGEAEALAERTDIRKDDFAGKRAEATQILREEYDVRAETRKNEPVNRVAEVARQKMAEQVPDVPAPVTELSGDDDGKTGMKGNYASLVQRAQGLPEEDRAPYLAQLERQFGQETKTGLINSSGKMRNRTTDEAMKAALDDAKINNPQGYAAYDKDIGAPARLERAAAVKEKDGIRKEKYDTERIRVQDETNRVRELSVDQRADAATARIEAALVGKSKGEQSEKVMTYMNGRLRDLTNEATNVQKEMAGALKAVEFGTPEEKSAVRKSYQPRQDALAEERTQINTDFKSMREKFGLPPMAETGKPEAKPSASSSPTPSRASQFKVIR